MSEKMNPWDERYSIGEFYYGTEPNDFLKDQVASISPVGEVLCLAEGEGRNAVYLAKLGFQVTAVDQSRVGLQKMHDLAKKEGVAVKSIVADLSEFEIAEDQWDAIVSIWCHVPPMLRQKLHSDVVKGLRKNGVLILEAYHPRQLEFKTGGPPVPELMMTEILLRDELHGLQFEIIREIERDVHEGKGHFGMSAVTQVLGKKESTTNVFRA
jgi:SAM-dependent methyltransferase